MGEQRKGLRCNVYRPVRGDCSNGGLSGRVDQVTLIGPGIAGVFAPTDDAPAVELGEAGGCVHARPVDGPGPDRTWWMFGGCFIYTSDGRFPFKGPLALHDRCETGDQARALSQ
jgi:hypothetical protein